MALNQQLNVAIIGGGIGGFATAVALQHHGIQAHVYEQAPELGEVGAAIMIHPPTQYLFREWGIDKHFYEHASVPGTIQLFTAAGEFVTNIDGTALSSLEEDKGGLRPASIRRTDILNVLARPIDHAHVHLDHKFVSLTETEDFVEVSFENGEVIQADVVIAANGIHSSIRARFSDDQPIYSGFSSIRTLLDREAAQKAMPSDGAVMYKDGDLMVLMQHVADSTHFEIMYPNTDTSWSTLVPRAELAEKLAAFDPKIVGLLDNLDDPVLARALYFRAPIERWSSKRVTLLGDAAHSMLPTLGQGANSAIAGADALARALAECGSVDEALQQYENERRPITTAIQNESQKFDKAFDLV